MPRRPTSLRIVGAELAPATAPIRRSISLQRAAADLDCDEATVRRMVLGPNPELEGHRLRGPRSPIRVYADSIEAHQRRMHLGPTAQAPARYAPPAVTETAEFRDILAGLQDLGVLAQHDAPSPGKRRRRA